MNQILPVRIIRARAGEIALTVRDDMTLLINPAAIAMAGNHNSATFIIDQPAVLNRFACRAEVRTMAGTTYRLVANNEFALTADIAVPGIGSLQLVYGDGVDINIKTTVAQFFVAPSLDALDQSDPDFQDGLAQLAAAAFADAELTGGALIFRNISGAEVDRVVLPGSVEDLDNLYLRLNSTNMMQGSILIDGTQRGVVFDARGSSPVIYGDGLGLRLRRAAGNTDITIEDSNGSPASRSPVMTLAVSDTRYTTYAYADGRYADKTYVDSRFVSVDGGQIVGPIRQLAAEPPATIETLVTRGYVDSRPIGITEAQGDARYLQQVGGRMQGVVAFATGQGVAFEPAGSAITEAEGALQGRHAAGAFSPIMLRDDGDARYLRQSGGQVSGVLFMAAGQPFISAMGAGNQPMLCVGTNDTGFWRTGGSIVFEVGRSATWIYTATGTTTYQPLSLAAAPTQPAHAVTKTYADNLRANSLLTVLGSSLPLTGTFQPIISTAYSIPRSGTSRVLVTLSGGLRMGTVGAVAMVQVRCLPSDIVQNVFAYAVPDGADTETSGVHLSFPVDVSGTAPNITVEIRAIGNPPPISLIGGPGEAQRTTITFQDAGPR